MDPTVALVTSSVIKSGSGLRTLVKTGAGRHVGLRRQCHDSADDQVVAVVVVADPLVTLCRSYIEDP